MPSRLSMKHIPAQKKRRPILARAALFISIPAILLLVVGILSFNRANEMMRQPAQPLLNISSNVMPSYQLASFRSLDEQSSLSGWLFLADGPPISTIILVHDQGSNRFPLGMDSPDLFAYLTSRGFHVLAFDLRNSGRSDGEMSTFGYAEWEDVLAAIRYVRQVSPTRDVLLYGFGTGVTASLLALDQLPPAGTESLDSYPRVIRELGFDRGYIRGLLLDTPSLSAESYMRPQLAAEGWLGQYLMQYTVPYAIRLSAGNTQNPKPVSILSRTQLPVFIAASENDSRIQYEDMLPLIEERTRLHPETTVVYTSQAEGTVTSFSDDQQAYTSALDRYFSRYFSR